jgi:VanZ family protein
MRCQTGCSTTGKGFGPESILRRFLFTLCSAVWMIFIFYLSSIPGEQLGPDTLVVNAIKKAGHFFIFGVLAALYLYALKGRKSLPETQSGFYLLSLFLTFLYTVSDEYHQSFTPGRHSTVNDVFVDVCGSISALILLQVLKTGEKEKYEGDYRHGKTVDH